MRNSIKKILALGAAAVISTACLCTAVSAEEYNASTTDINIVEEESERASRDGYYTCSSGGYVYINGSSCFLYIVYDCGQGSYVNGSGSATISGNSVVFSLDSCLLVDSSGNKTGTGSAYISGYFSGTTLHLCSISYYKD